MDQQTIDKLFEPFFTTRDVGRGSGLGLSTAYGIIKRHEGWIEVFSEVGVGTTFQIYLPLCRVPPSITDQAGDRSSQHAACDETILLVEDEPELRIMVQNVLQAYGYRVIIASNGLDALQVWDEHQVSIDLLLTDMVMPEGLSGWQLAEKLKTDRRDLKVVYTSGYTVDLIADASEELIEGQNFVQKPYRPQTLAETLRRALTGSCSNAKS